MREWLALCLLCIASMVHVTLGGADTTPPDKCPGSEVVGGLSWFKENPDTFEVPVHPRAADLDCYIKTKQRKTFDDMSGGCAKRTHGCKGRVAVTIVGELSRLDPNTTIASNVVAPYAHAGYEVVVFVTVQAVRPQAGWHGARFKTMPRYDDAQQLTVIDNFGALFLSHGAAAVVTHLYDLVRRPPMMPSFRTGGPGHSNGGKGYTRFQQAWESYPLHCLVHSNVWRDVHSYEQTTHQFDYLLKMRGDSHWLHAAPLPNTQHAGSVSIRECMPWEGYNDKFAYLPRAFAKDWMMLFEAYYDQENRGYTNSEQLQKLIAKRKQIPVVQRRLDFAMLDYYYWLPDHKDRLGCFPSNYAGITQGGTGPGAQCFSSEERRYISERLCKPWE